MNTLKAFDNEAARPSGRSKMKTTIYVFLIILSTILHASTIEDYYAKSTEIYNKTVNATKPVIETWLCGTKSPPDALIIATVHSGMKSGQVYGAGTVYDAVFEIQGFNRIWNFDNSALWIRVDGTGWYTWNLGKGKKDLSGSKLELICTLRDDSKLNDDSK
ncbi:MAG: hypothetical protein GY820_38210 [Gammaproteobacteria bacterium]|nr:hypothetical protein [Gammaproteobacteria bacterium]